MLNKSHFVFTKQQRSGIFFLMLFIVIFQIIYFFVDFSFKKEIQIDNQALLAFQQQIDSLKQKELEKNSPRIFSFNPNYISDEKGYQLGMSVEEIDKLLLFRSKDNFINSIKEFQEVTKISDTLLSKISSYFKFPEWVTNKKNNNIIPAKTRIYKKIVKKDLNKATAYELRSVYGIGITLSDRIVKYRKLLGGFVENDQLNEVYGLAPEVIEKILKEFKIINKPEIKKININNVSIKELSKIPYISFEIAKKIITYRSKFGGISSINELTKIQDFPVEKINRIELYLSID